MSRRVPRPVPVQGDASDPECLSAYSRRYLACLSGRGYSAWTLQARTRHLNRFLGFCEERSVSRPHDVTRSMLERYRRQLMRTEGRKGRPLGLGFQHQLLVSVRCLFRWLLKDGHLLHNPASDVELPRLGRRLPRDVLSVAQVECVLNHVDPGTPARARDRAMLETLYSTGLRRMELLDLELDDVNAEGGVVWVREGKGRKDRVVPIGKRALAWVERYLLEVRPGLVREPDVGILFLNRNGRRFSLDGFTHKVRSYVEASGLGKRGSCHLFRHSMATLMLENGADVRHVQVMLGHERLSTTQIYTHVSIRKLKEVHARTHPAKLERKHASTLKAEDAQHESADQEQPESPGAEPTRPRGLPGAGSLGARIPRQGKNYSTPSGLCYTRGMREPAPLPERSPVLNELLRRIKARLEGHYGDRLRGVILYGSEARGEAEEDSDVDLLVLLEGPFEIGREIQEIIHRIYPLQIELDFFRPLEVIPADVEDYEAQGYALYRHAKEEGIQL